MPRAPRAPFAVVLALACASAAAAAEAPYGALERAIFDAVNAHRASKDLAPERWSDDVAALAREHSRAMAEGRAGFGHDGFAERIERVRADVEIRGAAENLSKLAREEDDLREAALEQWLSSAVHRGNMEGDHDLTGVGVARAGDGPFYVTQIFVATASADSAAGELSGEIEDAIPEGESLTGRELYRRFLHNRFRESLQRVRLVSRDPGGSAQATRMEIALKDYRNGDGDPHNGIVAKTLVDIEEPFDMRHTLYLLIAKQPGPNDEFVYRPSAKSVRRVDLRRTSLLGTDFNFHDVAFQNIEEADYRRLPDEHLEDQPVYVVETIVKETVESDYSRTIVYLEQEHYVPLRIRYWDEFGVEVKEMRAPASGIREFGEAWVATESTMHDLRQQTSSSMFIDELDATPDFSRHTFSVKNLAQGR